MWVKLAVGAVVGVVLGYFLPPGYALWVILGVIGGYLAELWSQKKAKKGEPASQ